MNAPFNIPSDAPDGQAYSLAFGFAKAVAARAGVTHAMLSRYLEQFVDRELTARMHARYADIRRGFIDGFNDYFGLAIIRSN